jgi:hypothetical protein
MQHFRVLALLLSMKTDSISLSVTAQQMPLWFLTMLALRDIFAYLALHFGPSFSHKLELRW